MIRKGLGGSNVQTQMRGGIEAINDHSSLKLSEREREREAGRGR